MSLTDFQRWQSIVYLKNLCGEGLKCTSTDHSGFGLYTSRDTTEYIHFTSWFLDSVDSEDPYLITIKRFGDQNPLEVPWNFFNFDSPDDPTGETVLTGENHCAVTPGHAILEFDSNSVLHRKSWPMIVEVVGHSVEDSTLTVRVDKDCTHALDHVDEEDTTPITLSCWMYAIPENWQQIIRPDYFYGREKTLVLAAEDVPTEPVDGVYTLEAESPVMDEFGFDPTDQTFIFEGLRRDTETWEQVPQAFDRLFVIPNAAFLAFKTERPATTNEITLTDDLTVAYSHFRINYYVMTDVSAKDCKRVGYARCRHSIPSPTAGYVGEAGIASGYHCAKRIYDSDQTNIDMEDTDADDIRDLATPWQASPTGVFRYPSNGLCLQKNSCSHYESAVFYYGRDGNWDYANLSNRIISELIGGINHRAVKENPAGDVDDYVIERIQNPSALQLAGFWQIDTPPDMHPHSRFSGVGSWAKPVTAINYPSPGNDSLVPVYGGYYAFNYADPETADDGQFPAVIADFSEKRDPLNQTATTTDSNDLEMVGIAIERDTGQLLGGGVARASLAVAAQDLVFAPHIDTAEMDVEQVGQFCSFTRFSDDSDARLRLLPLIPEGKGELVIGSRETVGTPTNVGSGITRIELKNVTHSWGESLPGNTEDTVVSWLGGGDPLTCPPDPQREILNYHEPNKRTGGKTAGATRGDALRVEIGGIERTFAITGVFPHGGSSAGTWGGTTPLDGYSADQQYTTYGQLQDAIEFDDPTGIGLTITDETPVTLLKNAVVMLPGSTLQWTTYQQDDWQDVLGATHWYGEGLWLIPDSWFSGKPANICFRAVNCRWMDHRSIIPATLYNKIDSMVNGLEWIDSPMVGLGVNYDIRKIFTHSIFHVEEDPINNPCVFTMDDQGIVENTVYPPGWTSNEAGWTRNLSISSAFADAGIAISASWLAPPLAFFFLPDDTEIVEAWAQISATGLSRYRRRIEYEVRDCNDTLVQAASDNTYTDITGIEFAVIGFTSENDFGVIGKVAIDPTGSRVVDVTDIVTTMWNARNTPQYHRGYGAIFMPSEIPITGGGDSVAGAVPDLPESAGTLCTDDCPETPYYGSESEQVVLQWDSLSIDRLFVRVRLSDEAKERILVRGRFPSMKEIVPAGYKRYDDGSLAPL